MANDSITPRTAITRFVESDPQHLDETVRITRQRTRDASMNESKHSGSVSLGRSKLDAKSTKSGKRLSMSKKEQASTPRTTILDFIGSQESEKTIRIEQRIPSSSRTPLSPSLSNRRKSRQGNLLRQATERVLRKNTTINTENPTPRTTISSILSEGVDETPVVAIRNRQAEPIAEQPDDSSPGIQLNLRSFTSRSFTDSDDGSYMDSYVTQHSQSSSTNRLRVRPYKTKFPYNAVLEESTSPHSQVAARSQLEDISEDSDTEGRSNQVAGRVVGSFRVEKLQSRESDRSTISPASLKSVKQEVESDEGHNRRFPDQYIESEDVEMQENSDMDQENNSDVERNEDVEEEQNAPTEKDVIQESADEEDQSGEVDEMDYDSEERDHRESGINDNDNLEEGRDHRESRVKENPEGEQTITKAKSARLSERHWLQAIADLTTTDNRSKVENTSVERIDRSNRPSTSSHELLQVTPNKSKAKNVIPESEDESDVQEALPGFINTSLKSPTKSRWVQSTLDGFAQIQTPLLPRPTSNERPPTPDVPPLKATPLPTSRVPNKPIPKQRTRHPSKKTTTDNLSRSSGKAKKKTDNVSRSSGKAKKKKDLHRLPRVNTASIFRHFVDGRVSNEVITEVEKVADAFWRNVSHDLGAYAEHAKRMTIESSDVELLMKRQRLVNEKHTMVGYAERFLPLQYQREIIQVATSGNVLVPK